MLPSPMMAIARPDRAVAMKRGIVAAYGNYLVLSRRDGEFSRFRISPWMNVMRSMTAARLVFFAGGQVIQNGHTVSG